MAVRLLLDEIQNPDTHVHKHTVLQPELMVRDSSARLREPLGE